jgi:hypothetical protein
VYSYKIQDGIKVIYSNGNGKHQQAVYYFIGGKDPNGWMTFSLVAVDLLHIKCPPPRINLPIKLLYFSYSNYQPPLLQRGICTSAYL